MANPNEAKLDIKLISEWFIRPEEDAPKEPYYLAPMDLIFLFTVPIRKGLLFPFSNDPTRIQVQSLLERLRRALSIALVYFYPLAGRIETTPYEDGTLIYVDYNKGPGARLIHATMDLTTSDILSSTDVHPAVRSFFDLGERTVNLDGLTKSLLTVQVSELLDGVFIGFTMNHAVLDGTSFIHFVSALSEIFKSDSEIIKISREPIFNKHIPEGLGPKFKMGAAEDTISNYVTRFDSVELRCRIFRFSVESIATLKTKANEECGSDDISSFMALSGMIWKAMTRAHNLGPDEETSFYMPYSTRTRQSPPLSDDCFGNFVGSVRVVCKVDELLGRGLGWAASLLGQEVKNVKYEVIVETTKGLGRYLALDEKARERNQLTEPKSLVKIGGSHRFDMYGLEFGLGRAVALLMGFPIRSGKVTVNPGRQGRGSMELEISLKPQYMSALESDEDFMSYVTVA